MSDATPPPKRLIVRCLGCLLGPAFLTAPSPCLLHRATSLFMAWRPATHHAGSWIIIVGGALQGTAPRIENMDMDRKDIRAMRLIHTLKAQWCPSGNNEEILNAVKWKNTGFKWCHRYHQTVKWQNTAFGGSPRTVCKKGTVYIDNTLKGNAHLNLCFQPRDCLATLTNGSVLKSKHCLQYITLPTYDPLEIRHSSMNLRCLRLIIHPKMQLLHRIIPWLC